MGAQVAAMFRLWGVAAVVCETCRAAAAAAGWMSCHRQLPVPRLRADWAGVLGGKNGPLWSWVVGWLNLLGQVRGGWVGGRGDGAVLH